MGLNRHIKTENQIDHTCTARQFRRNLQNLKVKRWVDAASDQQLLLAKVKLIKKTNMEVKKNARRVRRHFNSNLATKAEATAKQNNIKALHDNIQLFY